MRLPYAGVVVSVLLVALLLTPPGELLDRRGAYAATQGEVFEEGAVPVELRDGLRSDPGEAIPSRIDGFNGTDDESWPEALEEWLAYDHLLVREYDHEGFYFPVQLMVLTARHAQAFHNPEVCFDVQGGQVAMLEPSSIPAPGPAEVESVPVGVMHITYPSEDGNGTDAPPRLVLNLYVVERLDAAADRTTWIRLSLSGVGADAIEDVKPRLEGLMTQIAPYLFHASGEDRSVAHWLHATAGWGGLAAGVGVALVPVAGHGAWLWRTQPEHDEPGEGEARGDGSDDRSRPREGRREAP